MFGRRNKSARGNAFVEVALMAPWIFLLFLAIFNFGFFAYAGISVSNSARAAVLEMGRRNSNSLDQVLACSIVKKELEYLPNSVAWRAGGADTACDRAPLVVTVGNAGSAIPGKNPDGTDNGALLAARVRVTYTSIQLFPLPFLQGLMTLSRKAEMRVYQ